MPRKWTVTQRQAQAERRKQQRKRDVAERLGSAGRVKGPKVEPEESDLQVKYGRVKPVTLAGGYVYENRELKRCT